MSKDHQHIPVKPLFKLNQPDDSYKYLKAPVAPGEYPYRLKPELKTVSPDRMSFHVAGDTGGVKSPAFQKLIAAEMAKQFDEPAANSDQPSFLFHVGDIVYHYGEADQYEAQFFKPYAHYPAPIYAIPGNHDSDVNPLTEHPYHSLDAFCSVFCGAIPRPVLFGSKKDRLSGLQPHIYWTLQSPLANIIGLYTNVPKYGVITDEQKAWFIAELQHAAMEQQEKALIVALHHSPYSADFNHGSSLPMIDFLTVCFEEAGVRPELVLSGHVHNYQRFEKTYADGTVVPFIVCGAGGFDELHWLAEADEVNYSDSNERLNDVRLMGFSDRQHGFLKLSITKTDSGRTIGGQYYVIPHEGLRSGESAGLFEEFEYLYIPAGSESVINR